MASHTPQNSLSKIKTRLMTISELEALGPTTATDLALILGADQSEIGTVPLLSQTPGGENSVRYLYLQGSSLIRTEKTSDTAIRLALETPVTLINKPWYYIPGAVSIGKNLYPLRQNKAGEYIFEYGAYPQTVAPTAIAKKVSHLIQLQDTTVLSKTGNEYPTLQSVIGQYAPEYEYNNRRYVFVKNRNEFSETLSNGEPLEDLSYCLEVEPISWIYDPKTKTAYTEKAFLSGLTYSYQGNQKYENSNIKGFLRVDFDGKAMQSHDFCQRMKHVLSLRDKADNQQKSARAFVKITTGKSCVSATGTHAPLFCQDNLSLSFLQNRLSYTR